MYSKSRPSRPKIRKLSWPPLESYIPFLKECSALYDPLYDPLYCWAMRGAHLTLFTRTPFCCQEPKSVLNTASVPPQSVPLSSFRKSSNSCHLTAPYYAWDHYPCIILLPFFLFKPLFKLPSSLPSLRCLCGVKTDYGNAVNGEAHATWSPTVQQPMAFLPCCLPLLCVTHDNCSGGL